jgi:hypothetical protein
VLVARKAIQSQFTREEMVEGVCDDLVRMRQLLYTAPSSNQILTDSDRIQNKRNRIKRSIKKIRAGTVKQGSMSVMFDWVLVKLWRSPARRRTKKSERKLQGSKTVIGVCIVNIAHILLHSTPIKIELILFD